MSHWLARTGGAETGGAETGGAEPRGAEPRGSEPGGGDSTGAPSRQRLREWYARRCGLRSGAPRFELHPTGAAGDAAGAVGGPGAAGGAVGATGGAAGAVGGTGAVGGAPGTAGGTGGPGVGNPFGAPGAAGVGAAAGGSGAVSTGSGGTSRPQPYFVPLLQQVLGQPCPPCPASSLGCPSPVQLQFPPTSPLPGPSPYTGPTGGLTEHREPESRPVSPESCSASPVRAARPSRRVPRQCPPAVPGTHPMLLRLSTAPRRTDFAASLVAEAESVCPLSVGDECALGTDVLEDRQEEFECFAAAVPHLVSMLIAPGGDPDAPDIPTRRSYAEAIAGEYSPQWQTAMDAEMASWKSTGTYVDEVPPPGANIVSGMWIFRVKRPPGSPPVFKARYVARGFSHLHEEIWLHRPPGFTGSFPPGTQWSLRRPFYGLGQAPREWHDTLRTTLAALGFLPSTADPSLFLRTDTSLPPFYVLVYVDDLVFATADTDALAHVKSELQKRHTCTDLGELTSYLGLRITRDRARRTITLTQSHMVQQVLQRFGFTWSSAQATPLAIGHSLSALPLDESVEPSDPYPELVGCLITSGMGLVLGGRRSVVLTGHSDASWVDDQATQRSSQGYTFSLGSGSVSWRCTRSSSVLSSSCEAEIYATAMAAQELRWLTYLLTDLGERPSSPPVLYLQQRGQLCLRYVATRANTADIFTKALQPGDHQRFCTVLGLVPTVPHLL
ncbi:unnamed protein product [Closterium sp. NIES-53]